ncbi:MAG: hypothetical protein ACK5WZ_13200, partial [Pseudobdellovibrionaceae bacterium]
MEKIDMVSLTLKNVLDWTQGQLLNPEHIKIDEVNFDGIGSDTRSNMEGKLFVALKGDQFDAHEFLPQALGAKTAGVLIHRLPEKMDLKQFQQPII